MLVVIAVVKFPDRDLSGSQADCDDRIGDTCLAT